MESSRRPRKRPLNVEDEKVYKFRILLPNGTSVGLTLSDTGDEMSVSDFLNLVRMEYFMICRKIEIEKSKRKVMWKNSNVYLEDLFENKIRNKIAFRRFQPHKCHILKLHDGEKEIAETFENMWDLTPDTDMLKELPESHSYETALADLIDNSLQAVWYNIDNERRLISVTVGEDLISIFDTGPGMDESDENSIVKWGKMGASLNRSTRKQAIGGKPPYLTPFFGMFGSGGPISSMHLGRHTLVSSKRKESKKVCTLHLERDALLNNSGEMTWRTGGGFRDPLEDEINSSPHGSFTKVEISEPKLKCLDTLQLKCRLKDIYFPYIQCDEVTTGKTSRPVEFQVNGEDLAEIEGGEVAITNLHSCNGPDFVLQLRFSDSQCSASKSPGSRGQEANARLKCVYFPIVEGKENFDRILEKLRAEGCGLTENFDTFSRVSIRRLGRLLPDARWASLPFMGPRQRKGEKAQVLKRCCLRVKCFVDIDAGFNPTPSKTDLANHHRYTTALKNFGNKLFEKENDIKIEIRRGQKPLSLSQLEKEYEDWIFQMHDRYDEEIDCGEDQPIIVVNPSNKKGLGISSDVVRVHRIIRRKGASWKSGQHIKIIAGNHKKNVYATLEYILLEGFQGDVGGEARLICRPLDVPADKGCLLAVNGENANLDVQDSLSFPISVIDSGKCSAMDAAEWRYQLEKLQQQAPSTIDLLSSQHCVELKIDGALPVEAPVPAGHVTPKKIVAVIRPVKFLSSSASKTLDQKFILKDELEMSMEVKYIVVDKGHREGKHIFSQRVKPSSHNGFHGLYIFSLGTKFPNLFNGAGAYKFSFSVICPLSNEIKCEKRVIVKPCSKAAKWSLLSDKNIPSYNVRVGSCLPPISVECYDKYDNRVPFLRIPELMVRINIKGTTLIPVDRMKAELLSDNLILQVSDIFIESGELDKIRPSYKASLEINCREDKLFSVIIPFQVVPGPLHHVRALSSEMEKHLLPGDVIAELLLEMFDSYDNHVEKGLEVYLNVDGFCFQDNIGPKRKVDGEGCINLDGILKAIGSYGKTASFSVEYDGKPFFEKEFHFDKRELRAVSVLPAYCAAGSQLENIVLEVVDSDGIVDKTIHDDVKFGQAHTLAITSESLGRDDSCRYTFRYGKCIVPSISVPRKPGIFSFVAAHSRHQELSMVFKVHVTKAPKLEESLSECDDVQFRSPESGVSPLQKSPVSASKHLELVESNIYDLKELHDIVMRVGELIGISERKLEMLNEQKAALEQGISLLQDSIERQSFGEHDESMTDKEVILKRIEEKDNTAASIYMSEAIQSQVSQGLWQDIVGIVALIGTVNTENLSRILAEYLGEQHMLAIVCKSYAAASVLERYEKNGEVDCKNALHAVATALGKSITDRFLVICLEDISPYTGGFKTDDPQKRLDLKYPLLPTGEVPPGFLGYAVNMINLDIHHLHIRTGKGYGLRETLFYLLFGQLQVYGTREQMKKARPFVEHGAISLDGGIIKGNGIVSLGRCRTPEVCFPVMTFEAQRQIFPLTTDILNQIEEKQVEAGALREEIRKETKEHRRLKKSFQKKKERLERFIADKGHLLLGNSPTQ